jgi:pilus assembly protein CpaF
MLEPTQVTFACDDDLRHAIERILAPLGRRVDEAEPLCDARLPDGSRVNVVLRRSPSTGPCSRSAASAPRLLADDLVALGTWTAPLRELLGQAVRSRLNVLVSGGTGSGKTTTLNALSGFVPDGERVVTIEDTAELRLQRAHVVRLEARPASVEGRGEVTIRRLVRNALRMRPDRIVVGEVRGPEALDMLGAMSSATTARCARCTRVAEEALRRLETLALMAGVGCRTPRSASRWRPRSTSWSTRRAWRRRAPGRRGGRGVRVAGARPRARSTPSAAAPALARAAVRRARRAAGTVGGRERRRRSSRAPRPRVLWGPLGRAWGRRGVPRACGVRWDGTLGRCGCRAGRAGSQAPRSAAPRPPARPARCWGGLGAWPARCSAPRSRSPGVGRDPLPAGGRRRWRRAMAAAAPGRGPREAMRRRCHSVRGALQEVARVQAAGEGSGANVTGPAAGELRAACEALALGEPTEQVLQRLQRRAQSPAWDAMVAAILLQREAGGDLAGLLRALPATWRPPGGRRPTPAPPPRRPGSPPGSSPPCRSARPCSASWPRRDRRPPSCPTRSG